jgi:hypothetical protein
MKICLVSALALSCSLALPAAELEEGPGTCRYGVRLIAATPRQDFRDMTGRTGFGAGLFAETALSPTTALQTRFDFISYPQTNQPGGAQITSLTVPKPITLAVDSTALGVDIRHNLPYPKLERVYLLGGLMGIRYEFNSSAIGTVNGQNGVPVPGIIRTKQKTSFKLGLAVGLGVELHQGLALSGRFTTIDINGTTFATLETSLSYRF